MIYYGLPEIGIRLNAFSRAFLDWDELRGKRGGELSRGHRIHSARPDGSGAGAGHEPVADVRHIILPQAFRIVIPPMTNDFIAMFKDSSIVSVITMVELTKMYGMLAMSTYDYIGLGVMTAEFILR